MTDNPARVQAGVPAGGQFASHDRTEASAELDAAHTLVVMTSTLNFDGPLERLSLQPEAFNTLHWAHPSGRDVFVLDAPYQRGSVWDDDQRRNLMRSLLLQIPVGAIIYNETTDVENYHANIIDGKQRIEAIRAFYDDELVIPASWVPADQIESTEQVEGWPVPGIRWSGTNIVFQRQFQMRSMPAIRARVKTIEEEAEIFRLINSAGVAQTDETLANAARIEFGE